MQSENTKITHRRLSDRTEIYMHCSLQINAIKENKLRQKYKVSNFFFCRYR